MEYFFTMKTKSINLQIFSFADIMGMIQKETLAMSRALAAFIDRIRSSRREGQAAAVAVVQEVAGGRPLLP